MRLTDSVRYFTEETGILACMSCVCGDASRTVRALGGVTNLAGDPLTEESIFDLASLTKLFTGLTVMALHEEGRLNLAAPVTAYALQFTQLDGVTVDQALGFEVGLRTPERIDAQPDQEGALRQLFAVAPYAIGEGRAYSDIPAMVLKYVIEGAADSSYFDAVTRLVLRPAGLTSVWERVPEALRGRCVSCDREHRFERGSYILREGILPGTPHDPKAHVLSPEGGDCAGHAGLFATVGDMARLAQAVLGGKILSPASLRAMARNRSGHPLPGGGWTQYLGSLCYVKHPNQYDSEVPAYMGRQALGLSGFTGHHLSIDPERGVFALYLGDRVLNRLTWLTPEAGKTWEDYGLEPDGPGRFVWEDGREIISSVSYVHRKDAHFHAAVADELGLQPVL